MLPISDYYSECASMLISAFGEYKTCASKLMSAFHDASDGKVEKFALAEKQINGSNSAACLSCHLPNGVMRVCVFHEQ